MYRTVGTRANALARLHRVEEPADAVASTLHAADPADATRVSALLRMDSGDASPGVIVSDR